MEAFATIDFSSTFDDTAFAPAHRIDGMHAESAVANEPCQTPLAGHS